MKERAPAGGRDSKINGRVKKIPQHAGGDRSLDDLESKIDRKTDHRRAAQPNKHFGHAAADGTDNISRGCGRSGGRGLAPLWRRERKSAAYEGVELLRNGVSLPCLLILPRSPTIRKSAVSGGIMFAVRSRKFQFSLLLAVAFSVSMWPAASEAYTPEQQAACSDDAFRLCSADIPDVDRVTACMVRKQDQLSPGCRVYFRPSEPEPAVRAGAPLNIKPAVSRKPVSERQ
jgi:hypothetical protein